MKAGPSPLGRPALPGLKCVLEVDIPAYLALLAILFVWLLALIIQFRELIPLLRGREVFGSDLFGGYLPISALITLCMTSVLAWRMARVQLLFRRGRQVEGQISRLWLHRDWASIRYVYTVQGQRYDLTQAVLKNRRVSALRAGDSVSVRVDPADPARSLIEALYR